MSDSMQSIRTGPSSFILFLMMISPFILFWNPLRQLINEYRLYRRCQQYPHIVVCKEISSTERKSDTKIIGVVKLVSGFLLNALRSFCRLMTNVSFDVLTFIIKKTKSTRVEISLDELSNSNAIGEKRTIDSTDVAKDVRLSTPIFDLDVDSRAYNTKIIPSKAKVQWQSERVFESSFKDSPMQNGKCLISSSLPLEQPGKNTNPKMYSMMHCRQFKHRSPSRMVATVSTTAITMTQSLDIDSSSLSEKMRKRRLEGGDSMEDNSVSELDIGATSRKKRKLNTGRVLLQGCVARRPTVGAWQTTKILEKRVREEREERLLRSMSRKRTKSTVENLKSFASAPSSTAAPFSSTSNFTFGQTNTNTSTSQTVSKEKHETVESAVTPAPKFQIKENAKTVAKSSNFDVPTDSTERKSERIVKVPQNFSFGSTSTATKTTTASPKKNQSPAATASIPAPKFQFNGSSGTINYNFQAKTEPTSTTTTTPTLPSFGAPSTAKTEPPPAFGATHPRSTVKGASSIPSESAPGSVAPLAPSFGGQVAVSSVAPTFAAAPAPSSVGEQSSSSQVFGATTVPSVAFGAISGSSKTNTLGSASGHTQILGSSCQPTGTQASSSQYSCQGLNAFGSQPSNPGKPQQIPFGNTKENTNPGSFHSTFQAPQPNGFSKPYSTPGNFAPPLGINGGLSSSTGNGTALPSFGGINPGGALGFGASAAPVASSGASARRMARKSRNRRR